MFIISNIIDDFKFVKRINMYTGLVKKGSKLEKVFIANPSRLKELLTLDARVYIKKADNPNRKTKFDLIAAENKEKLIIGIDSRIPNWLFEYLVNNSKIEELKHLQLKKKEFKIGKSRIDYLFENKNEKCLVELKICTLVKKDTLLFPDAVSARSTKHLLDLISAKNNGYRIIVYFIGLRSDPKKFMPNRETDPDFYNAFQKAKNAKLELISIKTEVKFSNKQLNFSEFIKI
ncbi:MAG: DNA/RNA nuclease SfsA [Candidatus Helarchaeota archaeon]